MAKIPRALSPWSMGIFAWSAGMVFLTRGARLFSDPQAGKTLAGMAAEKQKAFVEGALAAGRVAMTGGAPAKVAAAGLRPARRRVKANLSKLR